MDANLEILTELHKQFDGLGQTPHHQDFEVTQRCRIEDAGVEQDDRGAHPSIPQVESLPLGGEFVQHAFPFLLLPLSVGDHVAAKGATVSADPSAGDGPSSNNLDAKGRETPRIVAACQCNGDGHRWIDIGLKGGARYIVLVMIREFFDFLSFIALLVPWVLIIMSFFM